MLSTEDILGRVNKAYESESRTYRRADPVTPPNEEVMRRSRGHEVEEEEEDEEMFHISGTGDMDLDFQVLFPTNIQTPNFQSDYH